jgi:hypothetical protein
LRAPFQNLLEDSFIDLIQRTWLDGIVAQRVGSSAHVWDRDGVRSRSVTNIVHHVLDQDRAFRDRAFCSIAGSVSTGRNSKGFVELGTRDAARR